MTAVANPPSFANINRPAWGSGSQSLNGSSNHDDVRNMFAPRKSMQRTNSSSSIASNASTSSTVTVVSANGTPPANGGPVGGSAGIGSIAGGGGPSSTAGGNDANGLPITTLRKRPPQKAQWSANKQGEHQADFLRGAGGAAAGRQQMSAGPNGVASLHQLPPFVPGGQAAAGAGTNGTNGVMARPQGAEGASSQAQPVLYLVSLNGTFERKTISVPFLPDTLRIGRQTNKSTTPNTVNGFFDSKVLSRQHAEIYADRQGTIWIRDIKSSNGTFVNGTRLSAENRESEPHELQTNDHLELGIDIVSEDQKSVVHHKVAAKVEHAGFIKTSNNIMDMNFGDLDPANGAVLGNQLNGMLFRGRTGSQASLGPAGRMAPTSNMAAAQNNGLALQRGLWLTGPSTEAIVKKIHQEMRNAKQQSQDLLRTHEFIQALLSKDDIRNEPNPKTDAVATDPLSAASRQQPLQPISNGNNSISFRADPKARFSDPPAPPPQQPLPEKPDVPSLKRGSTERPKSGSVGPASGAANNTSPIRTDVMGQVLQLTDALNTAKREISTQHTRLRELEEQLHHEQEARKYAEELTQQLEIMSVSKPTTGVDTAALAAVAAPKMNGTAKGASALETALVEPAASLSKDVTGKPMRGAKGTETSASSDDDEEDDNDAETDDHDSKTDAAFRARIDSMMTEMEGMKRQLQAFQERAEKAEAERDADRETLAQMIQRIRQRDEDDAKAAAEAAAASSAAATALATGQSASLTDTTSQGDAGPTSTSPSMSGGRGLDATSGTDGTVDAPTKATTPSGRDARRNGATSNSNSNSNSSGPLSRSRQEPAGGAGGGHDDNGPDGASLSRSNTITPASLGSKVTTKDKGAATSHDAAVLHGIPYASMVGVVLIGMGLMAYLNGWQPAPGRLDR
ncbi:hypothetical protein HMPREF1624_06301 [Sporothrix schenckii ATCC 58251]|uniref:FHA domain-containing protein n=1 Tax=Sporothrix schenckii (strain ATCC 58251 / de Perez 2211183) TaxID=1391915 RepID=U7PQH5_SPOS1|nr:hypothetical protein HMPREF1624_06301 [Sporothrix schenckii ATCC 58251]